MDGVCGLKIKWSYQSISWMLGLPPATHLLIWKCNFFPTRPCLWIKGGWRGLRGHWKLLYLENWFLLYPKAHCASILWEIGLKQQFLIKVVAQKMPNRWMKWKSDSSSVKCSQVVQYLFSSTSGCSLLPKDPLEEMQILLFKVFPFKQA